MFWWHLTKARAFTCFSGTDLYINRKIPRNLPHSLTMAEKEDSFAPPPNILAYATECLKLRRVKTSVSQIPVEKSWQMISFSGHVQYILNTTSAHHSFQREMSLSCFHNSLQWVHYSFITYILHYGTHYHHTYFHYIEIH